MVQVVNLVYVRMPNSSHRMAHRPERTSMTSLAGEFQPHLGFVEIITYLES